MEKPTPPPSLIIKEGSMKVKYTSAAITNKRNGLYNKYNLSKSNGNPLDDNSEYFVLRLDANGEKHHVDASRKAILTYAKEIEEYLPQLSEDLIKKYS